MKLRAHTSIPLTLNLIGHVPQAKKIKAKTDTVLYRKLPNYVFTVTPWL